MEASFQNKAARNGEQSSGIFFKDLTYLHDQAFCGF